ncbi:DUF6049 family protein [Streptomyces sp. XD-27]|uniref:DUF6049 family protein n=1 Tax=Streptomyces sp. XD-27 TaxID=3062779 RepID=UPI0026F44366|nr:DUF6049 family protein [Streptomyces sp. XD-27]WKX72067.1 DUF6049 family protein [Streptomyces sp. XD-27]
MARVGVCARAGAVAIALVVAIALALALLACGADPAPDASRAAPAPALDASRAAPAPALDASRAAPAPALDASGAVPVPGPGARSDASPGGAGSQAAAAPRDEPPYPVRVAIRAVAPVVVGEGDEVVSVSGTLTNTSREGVAGARVGLRAGSDGAVGTRSGLAAVAARSTLVRADGAEVSGDAVPGERLRPAAEVGFRLTVPVSELRLGAPGAYALAVTVTDRDGSVRGVGRTFLSWYPRDTGAEPLRTTVLWPLTDVPHMQALTLGTGGGARPVFRDDALADSLAAGGRLRQMVEAGVGRPVTWVIDPDLIVQAEAMADGYRVARTPDTTDPRDSVEGGGAEAAASWLEALEEAVDGREVVALPYADPDLAALAHHRRGDLAQQGGVDGKAVVDEALGTDARRGLAWPEGGALDTSVTALARRLGLRSVLASGQGLSGGPDGFDRTDDASVTLLDDGAGGGAGVGAGGGAGAGTSTSRGDGSTARRATDSRGDGSTPRRATDSRGDGSTPRRATDSRGGGVGAGRELGRPALTALTYDTTLTGLLAEVPPHAVPTARQRLLAEFLTAVREAPYASRGLVVVPPRRMSGAAARALSGALADAGKAGLLEPVGLAAALRDPAPGPARPAAVAAYPPALRATEPPAGRLTAVAASGQRLRRLAQVLTDPSHTTASVRAALARAVSTGWRGKHAGNRAYARGLTGFLAASTASVRLVPKSTVTVAGDSATIPVTIENGLQQPVDDLEVRVVSSHPERVTVHDGAPAVQVSRAASRTVRVEVGAHANGPVRLTAQLYTASDGKRWGKPISFTADVRAVDSGAVAIVAVGVLLIVLAVVFQLGRARRRRAAERGTARRLAAELRVRRRRVAERGMSGQRLAEGGASRRRATGRGGPPPRDPRAARWVRRDR